MRPPTFSTGETAYCRFTGEAFTVSRCDGVIASLSDGTSRIVGELTRAPPPLRILPVGRCAYCDANRNDPMMPNHFASPRCESGGRAHCTCDTCF